MLNLKKELESLEEVAIIEQDIDSYPENCKKAITFFKWIIMHYRGDRVVNGNIITTEGPVTMLELNSIIKEVIAINRHSGIYHETKTIEDLILMSAFDYALRYGWFEEYDNIFGNLFNTIKEKRSGMIFSIMLRIRDIIDCKYEIDNKEDARRFILGTRMYYEATEDTEDEWINKIVNNTLEMIPEFTRLDYGKCNEEICANYMITQGSNQNNHVETYWTYLRYARNKETGKNGLDDVGHELIENNFKNEINHK